MSSSKLRTPGSSKSGERDRLQRGFKAYARELATEIRDELNLQSWQPLDPWRLADHLEIPIWPLTSYPVEVAGLFGKLTRSERSAFSAMLVYEGSYKRIVHNDHNALVRQRADISHELAHALLLHQPHPAPQPGQHPHFDSEQEHEARWLGSVLQVTDEFCVLSCRRQDSVSEAAAAMGVSRELMQWRINMSGAARRAGRTRAT